MDEFKIAGLTPVMGTLVEAPYVGQAHAVLECRVTEIRQPIALGGGKAEARSEEHTSELQSLMRISYAVFCLKTKKMKQTHDQTREIYTKRIIYREQVTT